MTPRPARTAQHICFPSLSMLGKCSVRRRLALTAVRARHQPSKYARRLDHIAAAHAVRAVVISVKRVCNSLGGRRRGDLLARSPSAAVLRDARRFSRRRRSRRRGCLLGRRGVPRRHHVRRGRYRIGGDGGRENGRRDGPLCSKASVPGCGADAWVQALRAFRGPAAGPQVHDFHGPAAARSVATRNVQRFAPARRLRLVFFEAGEDAVDVVHERPVWRGRAVLRRRRKAWWSVDVSHNSAIAGAIDLLTFGITARQTIP